MWLCYIPLTSLDGIIFFVSAKYFRWMIVGLKVYRPSGVASNLSIPGFCVPVMHLPFWNHK